MSIVSRERSNRAVTVNADLATLQKELRAVADPARVMALQRYFKTGAGEYGEGDRFLGLRVPQVRALARKYRTIDSKATRTLLHSPWHEERLLALLIMMDQYRTGARGERTAVYRTYLASTAFINNWDLVDVSAARIVGAQLYPGGRATLDRLARSSSVWERRIAIMATGHWIEQREFGPTLRLAKRLLHDEHDLIHKAVGWMLREVGKRDRVAEERFLLEHAPAMPRTMLRYAIEHFPERRRQHFLRLR
jgi:3-methyladenine DNA glycosylase AlkD